MLCLLSVAISWGTTLFRMAFAQARSVQEIASQAKTVKIVTTTVIGRTLNTQSVASLTSQIVITTATSALDSRIARSGIARRNT